MVGELAAYFYTENILVASDQPERIQKPFGVLTGLFNRVGLRMNMRKTSSIACHPCHVTGLMYLEAYGRRTMEMIPTFQDK